MQKQYKPISSNFGYSSTETPVIFRAKFHDFSRAVSIRFGEPRENSSASPKAISFEPAETKFHDDDAQFANLLACVAIGFTSVGIEAITILTESLRSPRENSILRSKGAHNSQGITTQKAEKIDLLSFSSCGTVDE